MANKNVFGSTGGVRAIPVVNTINNAGGVAYSLEDKEALAQFVMTGTFGNTFYVSAKNQLDNVKNLLNKLGPDNAEFIAKLAVHARKNGFMKDTPAYLLAWLTINGPEYFKKVFGQVIDNGKMLRNFVQIMRSGAVGRKSLGTSPKTMVKNWITTASPNALIRASVGNDPSLADVIKMVHPTPTSLDQNVMFQWILNGKVDSKDFNLLPRQVKDLIAFRKGEIDTIPQVPFELVTSSDLSAENWKEIVNNAGWHMIRMNLNTFNRKGIMSDGKVVDTIAKKLADPNEITKAKVFPYQIFTTWMNTKDTNPQKINKALEKALDFSLQTIPKFDGKVCVFVDVSGSMGSSVTGDRGSASSKIRCVDVAALMASAILRSNPKNSAVVLFDTKIHNVVLDPKSSVFENAKIISRFGGGGTSCQLPLKAMNASNEQAELIIYLSDNESWISDNSDYRCQRTTATAAEWNKFKQRNPRAKMVCIDITPNTTTQAMSDKRVLNIGGFSDAIWDTIANFTVENGDKDYWTREIEQAVSL